MDISAGRLNQRTHLPVRPYITHRGKRTHRGYGAAVLLIHPFFVDASAGGLNQRTHLPVRPYIMHRGNHPRRGKHHASRKTHQRGDWGGGYSDTFVRYGCVPLNGRKWLRCRDVPTGASDVYSACRCFQIRTGRYSTTVVIPMHPFFVDASH